MTVYADLVMVLNFAVDFLLLLGTNRLCGYPCEPRRNALSATVGCIYAGLCVLPQLRFLGNLLWRMVCLLLMSVIAFGTDRSALRRGIVFIFLSMALGGIALGMGSRSFLSLIAAAAGLWLLCQLGFSGKLGKQKFVTVELCVNGKKCKLIALLDTGNTLKDPLTGRQVLVVGAQIGRDTLGLTDAELRDPINTLRLRHDKRLRLIPYRAVGCPSGMMLAAQFDEIIIDGKRSSQLVGFAPQSIGREEAYQALAGGIL